MIKFSDFLAEDFNVSDRNKVVSDLKQKFPSIKKIKWDPNPKIGWWEDKKNLLMFHGTHYTNLEKIFENGIFAPSSGPTANWVSMALDPYTSFAYASMSGGESSFRAAGAKARTTKAFERAVIVCRFPISWVKENMNTELRGNMPDMRTKLSDKSEYEKWTKSDHEYYMATELRFPKKIDKKYIVGYMFKE